VTLVGSGTTRCSGKVVSDGETAGAAAGGVTDCAESCAANMHDNSDISDSAHQRMELVMSAIYAIANVCPLCTLTRPFARRLAFGSRGS
jgi:hypothetical protein